MKGVDYIVEPEEQAVGCRVSRFGARWIAAHAC